MIKRLFDNGYNGDAGKIFDKGEYMITAREAIQQTTKNVRMHITAELEGVEAGIRSKIALGERKYAYDGYISQVAKQEMEQCGFTVETGMQYNQGWVVIRW